jgi:hypothetical protein
MTVQRRLMHAAAALNVLAYADFRRPAVGTGARGPSAVADGRRSVERGRPHDTPLVLGGAGPFRGRGIGRWGPVGAAMVWEPGRADRAAIEVGSQRFNVTISIAEPEERRVLMGQLIARAPFFAKYLQAVTREIPLALLTPTS